MSFESLLFDSLVEVNDEVASQVSEVVESLPEFVLPSDPEYQDHHIDDPSSNYSNIYSKWVPSSRYPENLYLAYAGKTNEVTTAAQETAKSDLDWLSVSSGLDQSTFKLVIRGALIQQPLINSIDSFVSTARRFGEVRDLIRAELNVGSDEASEIWQALMRWLLYFFPSRYRLSTPNYSEIFQRIS